jgi:hypothetical protein
MMKTKKKCNKNMIFEGGWKEKKKSIDSDKPHYS